MRTFVSLEQIVREKEIDPFAQQLGEGVSTREEMATSINVHVLIDTQAIVLDRQLSWVVMPKRA